MADWRKVALAAILSDGKIDENEVKVLKKELWADNKIDEEEVNFLVELRNQAQKKAKARKEELNPAFEKLFYKAVEETVVQEGGIDSQKATWLRDTLFSGKKIDESGQKFLNALKKKASSTSPEFDALLQQGQGTGKKK